jgi:hypothetical protein
MALIAMCFNLMQVLLFYFILFHLPCLSASRKARERERKKNNIEIKQDEESFIFHSYRQSRRKEKHSKKKIHNVENV